MIVDFKHQITLHKNNKIIFAPNASGKTLFSESFITIENQEYKVINSKNILLHFQNANTFQQVSQYTSSISTPHFWNVGLENIEPLSIKWKDLSFLNECFSFMGLSFPNKDIFMGDFYVKRGGSKVIFSSKKNTISKIKKKLHLSSSEFEILSIAIILLAYKNSDFKLILDDPVEVASWENEIKFQSILEYFAKTSNNEFILLTHRISLFHKMLGAHKNISFKKKSPSYIYFLDSIPYWIQGRSSKYVHDNLKKNLVNINEIYRRSIREGLKKQLESLVSHIGEEGLKFQKINNLKIDELSNAKRKKYEFINAYKKGDFVESVNAKLLFITFIRTTIIDLYNKKNQANIKKLSKIKIEDSSKLFKKNYNTWEIKKLFQILNSSNHFESEWIMFNEVPLFKIIKLIERNFILRDKPLSENIKKMEIIVKEKEEFVKNNVNSANFIVELQKILNEISFIKEKECLDCKDETSHNYFEVRNPRDRDREIYICEDRIVDDGGGFEMSFELLNDVISE